MTSAVLAAFLTNPLEVIVVNSQTNKEYKWFKELTSPKKLAKIWFVGIRMRCLYYAIQAFPFFFIFEQLKVYLKCDHLDSEDWNQWTNTLFGLERLEKKWARLITHEKRLLIL